MGSIRFRCSSACFLFLLSCPWGLLHAQIYEWRRLGASNGLTVGINPRNSNSLFTSNTSDQILYSSNAGKSWNTKGYSGLTDTREILVHPNDTSVIFAAGDGLGGLVRSTNYGNSWTNVIPIFFIDGEAVTYDPSHPDTMYAGCFCGTIWRSWNRGVTWDSTGTLNSSLCALAVRPDSSNIILAGSGNGRISKSTDFGHSWTTVRNFEGGETPKILFSAQDPMIGYASNYFGHVPIRKTTDGGSSWFTTDSIDAELWALGISPTDDNVIYTASFDEEVTDFYKSTDGGDSWKSIRQGMNTIGYVWNIQVDPFDGSHVYMAITSGELFGSGYVYGYAGTNTGIRGAVIDSATTDTISNGYIKIQAYNDSINLAYSEGAYEIGYYPSDPTPSPVAKVVAYPYATSNFQLAFLSDSIVNQNFLMKRLPTSSISGSIQDTSNGHGVRATVRLFATTSIGKFQFTTTSDSQGNYTLPGLYVSDNPTNHYDSLVIIPDFPYAPKTFTSIVLTSGGLTLNFEPVFADILVVGATGSGDYDVFYQLAIPGIYHVATWSIPQLGLPPLSSAGLIKKKIVIYYTGVRHTPLAQAELDSLKACVDAGCNILITGQDFVQMNDTTDFVKNVLGIGYGGVGNGGTAGVPEEIFDGLQFFSGSSEGANNQTSRDILTPLNPQAKVVLRYGIDGLSGNAGIRMYNPSTKSKIVVLGAGFEAFAFTGNGPGIRSTIMGRVIDYFNSTEIDLGLAVKHGWNLVSLAVSVFNNNKVGIYPTSNSEAYAYTTKYEIDPQIHLGLGYWLRFPNPQSILVTGSQVTVETVTVRQGWNLIGSISAPIATDDIVQIPPGIIVPPIFAYGDRYTRTTTILPGRGFWLKSSADGMIVLNSGPGSSIPPAKREDEFAGYGVLTFRDAEGDSRNLYVDHSEERGGVSGELPPLPPEGDFDVRFGSNIDIARRSQGLRFPILISPQSFPIEISWDTRLAAFRNVLEIDGRTYALNSRGSIRLSEAPSKIDFVFSTGEVPITTSLSQNYPNPFNPTTNFSYQIAKEGPVTLRIYDVLGREVTRLVDEAKEPGEYTVSWEAANVASGIYFYELKAESFTSVKKMILIR